MPALVAYLIMIIAIVVDNHYHTLYSAHAIAHLPLTTVYLFWAQPVNDHYPLMYSQSRVHDTSYVVDSLVCTWLEWSQCVLDWREKHLCQPWQSCIEQTSFLYKVEREREREREMNVRKEILNITQLHCIIMLHHKLLSKITVYAISDN